MGMNALLAMAAVMTPVMPGAAATTSSDFAAFEREVDTGSLPAAAQRINAVLDARIARRATGRDPMLDAMQGVFVARYVGGNGTALLDGAVAGGFDPGRRDDLRLRAAQSLALIDRAAADLRFRALTSEANDPAVRRAATLRVATKLMERDPKGAGLLIAGISAGEGDPGARWEGDLLLSRAQALAGDAAAARATLALAWSEAPFAGMPKIAAARVARDLALEGDRAQAAGLQGLSAADIVPMRAGWLPRCGPELRPDDWVILEMANDATNNPAIGVVRASRTGVAPPFVEALAGSGMQGSAPSATIELRCRNSATADPLIKREKVPLLENWAVDHGYYAGINGFAGMASIEDAEGRLARLRTAYGADAPETVPTLLDLANLETGLAQTSRNAGYLVRTRDHLTQARTIAAKAGAPARMVTALDLLIADVPTSIPTTAVGIELMEAHVKAVLGTSFVTPEIAAETFLQSAARALPTASKLDLADRTLAFLAAHGRGRGDPLHQAVTLRKIQLMHEAETPVKLAELRRDVDAVADECQIADTPPDATNLDVFSPDDYPADLARNAVEGLVSFELSVTAAGKPDTPRILFASPPRLFDALTIGKAGQLIFTPAERGAKPVACRFFQRVVRWKLPDSRPGNAPAAPGQDGS